MALRGIAAALASSIVLGGCYFREHNASSLANANAVLSTTYVDRVISELNSRKDEYAERIKEIEPQVEGLSLSAESDEAYNTSLVKVRRNVEGIHRQMVPEDLAYLCRAYGRNLEVIIGKPNEKGERKELQCGDLIGAQATARYIMDSFDVFNDKDIQIIGITGVKDREKYGDCSYFLISTRDIGQVNTVFNSSKYPSWNGMFPYIATSKETKIEWGKNEAYASRQLVDGMEIIERGSKIITGGIIEEVIDMGDETSKALLHRSINPMRYTITNNDLIGRPLSNEEVIWTVISNNITNSPDSLYIANCGKDDDPVMLVAAGKRSSRKDIIISSRSEVPNTIFLSEINNKPMEFPFVGDPEDALKRASGKKID